MRFLKLGKENIIIRKSVIADKRINILFFNPIRERRKIRKKEINIKPIEALSPDRIIKINITNKKNKKNFFVTNLIFVEKKIPINIGYSLTK